MRWLWLLALACAALGSGGDNFDPEALANADAFDPLALAQSNAFSAD